MDLLKLTLSPPALLLTDRHCFHEPLYFAAEQDRLAPVRVDQRALGEELQGRERLDALSVAQFALLGAVHGRVCVLLPLGGAGSLRTWKHENIMNDGRRQPADMEA